MAEVLRSVEDNLKKDKTIIQSKIIKEESKREKPLGIGALVVIAQVVVLCGVYLYIWLSSLM